MIRVQERPPPADFDARVRGPGEHAIRTRAGLPPYWRGCLDDLEREYAGICAYSGVYIDPTTGERTVDHYLAIDNDPQKTRVYDWSNYRLASLRMNRSKGVAQDVLDPFEVQDGWFQINLVSYEVVASPGLPDELARRIDATIRRLKLNNDRLCRQREADHAHLRSGEVSFEYLARYRPFLAREIQRQGRDRPGFTEAPPAQG